MPCRTGGLRPQPPACCHAHRDPAGGASPVRSSRPGSAAADAGPGLCYHDHEPEREAPVPTDDPVPHLISARQRPTPGRWPPQSSLLATARHPAFAGSHSGGPARVCCRRGDSRAYRLRPGAAAREPRPCSAGPPIIAAGIPAVAGVPALARRSCRGRIRHGPSMYEMEGPCPASPHRLASCPALPTPRAARRGQVPVRETSLPAPPTFPGSPPGGARFRTVKTFLLPPRAPRKSLRPAISGSCPVHKVIHRKRAVIRI